MQHDSILVIQACSKVVYEPWWHTTDQTKTLGSVLGRQLEERASDARGQWHKVDAIVVCSPAVVAVLIPVWAPTLTTAYCR